MSARYCSHCYALCAVLLWSSAYVFTKVALASFTPATLGFLRCAVAALALLCLAARRAKPAARPGRAGQGRPRRTAESRESRA